MALVVFVCLLLPDGVDPRDVVVPASVVLVVLVRLQWTFYKKHL
jgi:hypothetical protein